MSLILGTLEELKVHLLNEALRSDTQWDATLAALGKGVAERFEKHCNRRWLRTEGDVYECSADRAHVVLPRYPVEAVTTIEIRRSLTEGWTTLTNVIENQALEGGLLLFGADLGGPFERIRITYTGGYWFDASADGSLTSSRSWQQGSVDLAANDESKAIEFDTEFAEAPLVDVSIVPPEGGTIITAVPSAITTAGFTALLAFPIPATGYKLQWKASTSVAADVAPSAQPDGSTARPADLYLAWLLQCEFAWKLRDKLGVNTSIGGGSDGTQLLGLTLAGMNLVPEVENILRAYRRYSLT